MLYILNASQISDLNTIIENSEGQDTASAKVFCKKNETFKADDVNRLLSVPGSVELIQIAGKDDMLICLGGIFETCEKCTILDPSLPVPDRYADKVVVVKKTAARKRTVRKKKAERKPDIKESNIEEKNTSHEEKEVDFNNFMPIPEKSDNGLEETASPKSYVQASLVPDEGDHPEFDDEANRKMYELLHIKSSDVGFTWPTDMLMGKIVMSIQDAEDDADIKMAILSIRGGEKIWNALKDHLDEAKAIAEEM